ncbi:MAG: hypothetical protein JWN94_1173 [Betaproteobacteria bacterium]|nr:hypothetical protein [Betaproteobacteria bacterium]
MNAPPLTRSLSHELSAYIAGADARAIPPQALDAARLFMLDTLAVAWAGSEAPGCREIHATLADAGGRADSTAWGFGGRLPATAAALLNGTTAAALDFDSLSRYAPVHVPIVVLPAALAIAERKHASGSDFLAALTIGSDVLCRLGAAVELPHRGFFYTSAFGGIGAAAAAARLLRLDVEQTRHALGLAFCQAGGTQQANIEPSLSKRMLSGFAARAGVDAALLAERGITAPADIIEGQFGLFALYQQGNAGRLVDKLGIEFRNTELSVKKFPSCGCNHTAIAATLKLVQRYDLKPDDVDAIEVTVSPYIDRISGMEYDPGANPQVAAQFSIRYSIACALVRRRLGLAEIDAAAATDPQIVRHVRKVSVIVDPALTGERGPVTVMLRTRTHGEISERVEHVPGSVESPLSQAELDEKFGECFGRGVHPLDAAQVDALSTRVNNVASWPDMATFFDGFTAGGNTAKKR